MLKKTITYEDFNGQEVTEDFYFHLSKADLVELEMSKKGGLEAWLKRVVASQDGRAIMEEFKNLIMMSVGQKSDDGKQFKKSVEIRHAFKDSPAYDVLFMELVTDAAKAADFVNGLLPKGLDQQLKDVPKPAQTLTEQIEAERVKEGFEGGGPVVSPTDPTATGRNVFEKTSEPRQLTQREVEEMDSDELKSGLMTGRYRLP